MARIYVSSTYKDLQECREQVRIAIRQTGHIDVAMEYYIAENQRPLDKCLQDIEECDLYIGIFAWRYGFIPQGHDTSITELEFCKAIETQKDCLIFLTAEDAEWPANRIEFEAYEKIKVLRSHLVKDYLSSFFRNKDDLRANVITAIQNWSKSKGLQREVNYTDWNIYKREVYAHYQWVRLSVIAGAKQDRIAMIPLTEVFIPQITEAGRPIYEIPDDILQYKKELFEDSLPEELLSTGFWEEETLELEALGQVVEGNALGLDPQIEGITELSLEILFREHTQVILGGPGSGKSTLFHYAMLKLCNSETKEYELSIDLKHSPIPFLIELRQYVLRKDSDFISYIVTSTRDNYGVTIEVEDSKVSFYRR